MKDPKINRLTPRQFQILRKQQKNTDKTDAWLRKQGLTKQQVGGGTHSSLIQAQRQAHLILTKNNDLLTSSQKRILKDFQQLMATKRTRETLKPESAYPILNISRKIHRHLFKQHRQTKA